jgi:hypothetical protein
MDFDTWKKEVEVEMIKMSGLSPDDIEDFDYWSEWKANSAPDMTAMEALENAGW